MKRLLLVLLVVALGNLAYATPTLPSCPDGVSMATYISTYSGGCIIGDKEFSGFNYTPSGTTASQVAASAVTVDTVGPAVTGASILGPNIGLQFNAPWTASGSGITSDASISFIVSVLSGASIIEDFGLGQTSGITGTGTASIVEDGCGPAPCTPVGGGLGGGVITLDSTSTNIGQAETFFTPFQSSVEVSKDIDVSSGSAGFASLSVAQDTFSQVPEPASIALFGSNRNRASQDQRLRR